MAKRSRYYKLNAKGEPEPCDAFEGTQLLTQIEGRCILKQRTTNGFFVTTVFTVQDTNWFEDGPPWLFHTYVYGPNRFYHLAAKYTCRQDAMQGHQSLVATIQLLGVPDSPSF